MFDLNAEANIFSPVEPALCRGKVPLSANPTPGLRIGLLPNLALRGKQPYRQDWVPGTPPPGFKAWNRFEDPRDPG